MDNEAIQPAPLLRRRWVRALLIASLTAWLIVTAWVLVPAYITEREDPYALERLMRGVLLLGIFGIPIAICATFPAGVLALLIADALGLHRLWHAAIVGAFAGALIWLAWTIIGYGRAASPEALLALTVIGGLSGLAGSTVIGVKENSL